jgi:F-type H+-transporting ATPase subunit b
LLHVRFSGFSPAHFLFEIPGPRPSLEGEVRLLALAENSIQLVPDGTLVFHIALICIMVAVLNRTLFKPINQVLEERELRTKGSLSETGALVRRIGEQIQQYESQLRHARSEGYRELEQQKLRSVKEREQKVAALKDELASWTTEEKRKLGEQAEQVRKTLEFESRTVATEIASRLLGRPLGERISR